MSTGKIQVYYGAGRGKTSAALGYAIHEASKGESVIVIQFLKRKDEDEISFLGRLEPEIRLFRFQEPKRDVSTGYFVLLCTKSPTGFPRFRFLRILFDNTG